MHSCLWFGTPSWVYVSLQVFGCAPHSCSWDGPPGVYPCLLNNNFQNSVIFTKVTGLWHWFSEIPLINSPCDAVTNYPIMERIVKKVKKAHIQWWLIYSEFEKQRENILLTQFGVHDIHQVLSLQIVKHFVVNDDWVEGDLRVAPVFRLHLRQKQKPYKIGLTLRKHEIVNELM